MFLHFDYVPFHTVFCFKTTKMVNLHFDVKVQEFLEIIFEERWIGRRGAFEGPVHSPNLTPFDFLVGYLKS